MEVLSFVLYFLFMLGIGVYFFFKGKGKEESEKDYFLGGRKMGPWVTAMSAQASDIYGTAGKHTRVRPRTGVDRYRSCHRNIA